MQIEKLLTAEALAERADYYDKWAADIRAMNGMSVDADHSAQTAAVLRALTQETVDLEHELQEARAEPWPEWAEKLLRVMESFGAEYEYDDEINLPDELAEWLHHYASELKRTAAAKDLSREARGEDDTL